MRITTSTRRALGAGALVLALAGIGACTGGDKPDAGGSKTSSAAPKGDTVRDAANGVLAFSTSDPVTSTTGTIPVSGKAQAAAKVDVISLTRGNASTVVLMKLTSADEATVADGIFNDDGVGQSIDGVNLVVGDQKFFPGEFRYGKELLAANCTCTELIRKVGPEGVWLSASFEALPAGAQAATLDIPGFKPVEVTVTEAK